MIRCLSAHGLPIAIYAVEIDGHSYALEEIEQIVRAQVSDKGANSLCCGAHRTTAAFCGVLGCDNPTTGNSTYCKKHEMRFKRHGDPAVALRPWDKKKGKVG
jgi:hypothetical protein